MNSLWQDTVKLPHFEALQHDIKTDVLIVGGGMAGILCAHMLDKAGVDYALIEAAELCGGTTGHTTAKITAQHGLIYDKLIRTFDQETAKLYLELNLAALERYRQLCDGLDCSFREEDAYVYSLDDPYKIERELKALQMLGYPAELATELPLPFSTAGAVKFPRQAQFHPLKFIAGILPGLTIYENTKLLELMPHEALTDRGRIRARKIIIATHFPLLNKHGGYFLKLYQSRSYVLALQGAVDVHGMYLDENEKGLSFRNYGDLLLLGGGGHRTGKKGGGWTALRAFAGSAYPQAREAYRWAAQDCMSLDGIPYIGQYSAKTPDLYVATGFNKWGMTGSMAAAMLLSDLVRDRDNPYASAFSPDRCMLHPQLAVNGFEAAVSLLTPTAPRCPHMGCALKYNAHEHSWDCPCHGSRFEESGKLIENPATDDKKMR